MSGGAVNNRLRLASAQADCNALQTLGVVAARMTGGNRTWAHAGILYRCKKEIRFFQLKTHQQLDDGPVKDFTARCGAVNVERVAWIEPAISRERALLVIGRCRSVLMAHKERQVPYGFRYCRTAFDEHGLLSLGPGEVGLTCATIVDAVFAAEKIPLVAPSEWPSPDDDDKKNRRNVLADIRTRDPKHAEALEAEIDAPRIRPEEVVAAAAIHPIVGTFATLLEGAAVVTNRLGL